jgi:hypothetical protein
LNKYLVSSVSPASSRNCSGITIAGQNRFLAQIEQLQR